MKAVALVAPKTVRIESRADLHPDPQSVLLKVRMVGLCGSDLNSYRGRNPMVSYPRVLGHEVAATVVNDSSNTYKSGTDVTMLPYTNCGQCASCLRGRPNACEFNRTLGVQRDGAMIEYMLAPASTLFAARLSIKELCLVEPLTVGFHAVARGRVTSEDTVAIIGCGGVGLGAIAAAAYRGALTIGIDVDDEKLNLAKSAGAGVVINSVKEPLHSRLSEMTGGRGPDVIVEAIGLPETFRAAVEEVAFTGRVVYIGYAKEPVAYETRLFVQKELDILGSRNALRTDFDQVIRMLEEKRFPVDEAISSIVTMDEVPHALRVWNEDPSRQKKIVVTMDAV